MALGKSNLLIDNDESGIETLAVAGSSAMALWTQVVQEMRQEYLDGTHNFPWIIGFSGGKDSTLVVHAAVEALTSLPPSRRRRAIHVVSNDTLVESPVVIAHLDTVTSAIRLMAIDLDLPITVARTTPEITKSFWVLLIGKGYPSPNQTMRWCTDRLKIQPTSEYIKKYVSEAGAAVVVLGVRRDESETRQNSINRHKNLRDTNLSPPSASRYN